VIRKRVVARILMWLAIAFAVTMALLPHPPHMPVDQFGDKVEHMLAFAVMSLLGAVAHPDTPPVRLGERLSFLGALIEVFQSIPALHRDCDVHDWIADTISIAVVLTLYVLVSRASRARKAAGAT